LRASELICLRGLDVQLEVAAHVSCLGKGRKQRITPLTKPMLTVLRSWLGERGEAPDAPLFSTHTGRLLSRDALERGPRPPRRGGYLPVAARQNGRAARAAASAAMRLLHAGVDTTVIALCLGHEQVETTRYLQADLALKEQALARTTPAHVQAGRYRPPDTLLAFLQAL
jgi:integrase